MRLFTVLTAFMLPGAILPGQEKVLPPPVPEEAVIIPVKTLSGDAFNRLAKMLAVFDVRYVADDKLRTILVYARPRVIGQIKQVVAELDRPGSEAAIGHNIEMTLAFLRCSNKPPTGSDTLPADLESAAKQLRAATQYKTIELWDLVPIRMQEGRETNQLTRLPGSLPGNPAMFATADLNMHPEAVIRKDSGRFVRFSRLDVQFRIPYAAFQTTNPQQYNLMDVRIRTSGDFKEGQKTILGKLSGAEDETATFVVISLKVID